MTIETQSAGEPITKSGPYNGNGVTAAFDYDFQIQADTELTVTRQNADLSEDVLTLTTDYTVSGVGSDTGGQITLVAPATSLTTGEKLVIQYNGDYNQSVDYSNQGSIQLSILETALDKVTMHLRTLKEQSDRAVKVDAFGTTDIDALTTNINVLAAIESEITTVAGITAAIATVNSNASNINTVAGISANVTTVAGIASNVTTVAGISADVTTVAGIAAAVSGAAGNASAAAASASAAATSASSAATSASNASTSASNAATSASTASTQASNASTSASNAATSASTASTQATNAATSASTASTQATNAATSASTASTHATNASNSASTASTQASNAAASAASAAASYDSFDDRYLGPKSSAPTLDNDGNALLTGALYFNTTDSLMYVRTSGAAWSQASVDAANLLVKSNNLSDLTDAATARTNLGLGSAAIYATTAFPNLTVDTNTLHVDATNNRVGIGTTSPSAQLEVSEATNPTLEFRRTGSADGNGFIRSVGNAGSVNSQIELGGGSGNRMVFTVNGSERLRISSTGAFGLSGTNYGTAGQFMKSAGSASTPIWTTIQGTRAHAMVDGVSGAAALVGENSNTSSVTDNGVGIYQINFTSAFSAATYQRIQWCKTAHATNIYMNFGASDAEPKNTGNTEGKVVNDTGAGATFVDSDEAAFLLIGALT